MSRQYNIHCDMDIGDIARFVPRFRRARERRGRNKVT